MHGAHTIKYNNLIVHLAVHVFQLEIPVVRCQNAFHIWKSQCDLLEMRLSVSQNELRKRCAHGELKRNHLASGKLNCVLHLFELSIASLSLLCSLGQQWMCTLCTVAYEIQSSIWFKFEAFILWSYIRMPALTYKRIKTSRDIHFGCLSLLPIFFQTFFFGQVSVQVVSVE